jgi:hypothetical protein
MSASLGVLEVPPAPELVPTLTLAPVPVLPPLRVLMTAPDLTTV